MRLWFFADHLGTPVLITNATGSTARRRIFEPFGKLVAETELGGYAPPVFFTGKRYEAEAAMYDFGARWYDATTAAFASVDPVIGDLANPLAHNAYSYVLNRAMNLVDPDGRTVSDGPAISGLGIGGFGLDITLNPTVPVSPGSGDGGSPTGTPPKPPKPPNADRSPRKEADDWKKGGFTSADHAALRASEQQAQQASKSGPSEAVARAIEAAMAGLITAGDVAAVIRASASAAMAPPSGTYDWTSDPGAVQAMGGIRGMAGLLAAMPGTGSAAVGWQAVAVIGNLFGATYLGYAAATGAIAITPLGAIVVGTAIVVFAGNAIFISNALASFGGSTLEMDLPGR